MGNNHETSNAELLKSQNGEELYSIFRKTAKEGLQTNQHAFTLGNEDTGVLRAEMVEKWTYRVSGDIDGQNISFTVWSNTDNTPELIASEATLRILRSKETLSPVFS